MNKILPMMITFKTCDTESFFLSMLKHLIVLNQEAPIDDYVEQTDEEFYKSIEDAIGLDLDGDKLFNVSTEKSKCVRLSNGHWNDGYDEKTSGYTFGYEQNFNLTEHQLDILECEKYFYHHSHKRLTNFFGDLPQHSKYGWSVLSQEDRIPYISLKGKLRSRIKSPEIIETFYIASNSQDILVYATDLCPKKSDEIFKLGLRRFGTTWSFNWTSSGIKLRQNVLCHVINYHGEQKEPEFIKRMRLSLLNAITQHTPLFIEDLHLANDCKCRCWTPRLIDYEKEQEAA